MPFRMITRRRFLRNTSLVSLAPLVPTVLSKSALAIEPDSDRRALVVIQLDGGNDGINTIIPFGDDAYGRARNKLRIQADEVLKIDDHTGLHPNMRDAKALYDQGQLTIIQGAGYPNPNRSHFASMQIWHTAHNDDRHEGSYGWLGRALDQHRGRAAKSSQDTDAVYVGSEEMPAALFGRRSTAISVNQLDEMRLEEPLRSLVTTDGLTDLPEHAQLLDFVSHQTLTAYAAAADLEMTQAASSSGANYPSSGLGRQLQVISKLLRSGSGARVFYTVLAGFDTHSNQRYTHAALLGEFAAALAAFLKDLSAGGLDDRVAVLAFSEFGRRVEENGSSGTDHGTAGPVFLAGSGIQGGLVGETPDLTDLLDGDLKSQIDFRRVYATVLQDWMNLDPLAVLGLPHYPTLPLFS